MTLPRELPALDVSQQHKKAVYLDLVFEGWMDFFESGDVDRFSWPSYRSCCSKSQAIDPGEERVWTSCSMFFMFETAGRSIAVARSNDLTTEPKRVSIFCIFLMSFLGGVATPELRDTLLKLYFM